MLPDIASTPVLSVALGISLAAATGFRVFLPLLAAALAARAGWIPLNESFAWLQEDAALLMLGSATLIEGLAYFIPGLDHMLDLISAPAALIAGAFISAAVMTRLPPGVLWPLALVAGGGVAAVTKGSAALVRAKTGLTTGGLGNPLIAAGETVGSVGLSLLAIALPLVCLLIVLALLAWAVRRLIRRRIQARDAGKGSPRGIG